MTKILAFAGSNSPNSINHELIVNISRRLNRDGVEVLNLSRWTFPMYSITLEKEGIPESVVEFSEILQRYPRLIVSVSENNRTVSAFFKNIIDWLSRMDRDFLQGKQVLLMSTSPGAKGGAAALEYTIGVFKGFGATVVNHFSLPGFYDNFDLKKGIITNEIFDQGVLEVVTAFNQQTNE